MVLGVHLKLSKVLLGSSKWNNLGFQNTCYISARVDHTQEYKLNISNILKTYVISFCESTEQ